MLIRSKYPYLVLFVFSLLWTSFFSASPAQACSCASPPDPLTARDRSNAVFTGTVLAVNEVTDWSEFMPFTKPIHKQVEVILEVQSIWKGITASQVRVITESDSASCGIDFQPGRSYLVYATFHEGSELYTHLCTRTAEVANAGEDLHALGQGTPPGEKTDLLSRQLLVSYGLPAAIAVVALAAIIFMYRKKRGLS
ncbi:hypothetical protein [Brevibacillus choshinensis]|uniref:Tissue inhibitor of metalloproteinase n=1 Tax=Brevibacillus choshinensis TaxID=54911 RepID=A0ABX7FKU1_BRECH|nr:hypothetical protein [Brevibacillus choshinensis]QRG66838.1 hypothetical protein JNE38_25705 [Brevibacillus choshinensis]